ncbi:unnamed protein product [Clonostachys rosea f. rosea IK726]|uniref:Uncharacterized protein n=1 Tax=Clonostachys rosea f. rosea IK726 TaxID=1349383 RepID=A0ACA9UDZ2_BIOOC|nr:unnamed protein product [Clonostachys rosea f. rosea IK726]
MAFTSPIEAPRGLRKVKSLIENLGNRSPPTVIPVASKMRRVEATRCNFRKPMDNIRSLLFFVVKFHLDEKLLRAALDRLIRDHLPLLGGRIKRASDGTKFEYHIPEPFQDNHKLFEWTSRSILTTLDEANLLPSSMAEDSLVSFSKPSIPEIEQHWRPADWPLERRHDKPDTPLLLVHLTSYADATILSTNLPHAVADQMGYASIIKAWLQITRGETPRPFLELKDNTLFSTEGFSAEDLYGKGRYHTWDNSERRKAILHMIPELILYPKEVRQVLRLSVSGVERLRGQWDEKTKQKYGVDSLPLTNGSVISALVIKLGHYHRKTPKPLTHTYSVNLRGRHPALPSDIPYLHNALTYAYARVQAGRDVPAFELAHSYRTALSRAQSEEDMARSMAASAEHERCDLDTIHCDPGTFPAAMTNWTSAWRGIDFSSAAAATNSEQSKKEKQPVRISEVVKDGQLPQVDISTNERSNQLPLVLGHSLERNPRTPTRFSSVIMCKSEGAYWCDFTGTPKSLAAVKELLKQDPHLETI